MRLRASPVSGSTTSPRLIYATGISDFSLMKKQLLSSSFLKTEICNEVQRTTLQLQSERGCPIQVGKTSGSSLVREEYAG